MILETLSRILDVVDLLATAGIVAGAEVYYFRGMGRAEQLPKLCIEGTRALLLEMPFEQWTGEVLRDLSPVIDLPVDDQCAFGGDQLCKTAEGAAYVRQVLKEIQMILFYI